MQYWEVLIIFFVEGIIFELQVLKNRKAKYLFFKDGLNLNDIWL